MQLQSHNSLLKAFDPLKAFGTISRIFIIAAILATPRSANHPSLHCRIFRDFFCLQSFFNSTQMGGTPLSSKLKTEGCITPYQVLSIRVVDVLGWEKGIVVNNRASL